MTQQQKLILLGLAALTVLILSSATCLTILYLRNAHATARQPAAVESPVAVAPTVTKTVAPTPTSTPEATLEPVEALTPTPTNTRVIRETATPTVTPTMVNCIHDIADFEVSGVVTDAQVEAFLRDTLPLSHLDHCLKIRYINRATQLHDQTAAGRFMPVIRFISVYPVEGVVLTPDDIFDTLTHEVGHNVHYNMRVENLALADRWEDLYHQNAGFVSDYARTNEFEDFAESYRAYVREPQTMQLLSPVKYEFMRIEVFETYEYPR